MASQEAIQNILKAEYNSTRWKAFLSELFTSSTMFSSPTPIAGINTAIAKQALHIGSIALDENGISRKIAIYEVTLAPNVVLERNRVGLRNLLKQAWKDQDAAFIVYYKPGDKNWRFSYVSELKKFNEAGEYVANNTEPKRYTYVLGETETCRTASERFYALQQKASNATLDDVKEAFSVEKLSKTFFADYKVHYQDFVQYLTGKRLEKVAGKWEEVVKHAPNTQLVSVFNNNEKDVRDFCKKLLGRVVFLYFIQKKGWLGVPVTDDWGKGNYNYISDLFKHCRNPDIFYSEYLSKLFFDTLNQQRDQDIIEIIPGEPCRIPYLNGGLFEEDNANHRNLVLGASLFKNLFGFFDQYNFTIYEDDPNDHTVAVDPEMLGHIFENLLEDNKDKGAFYTPKEIVHYMCQESLIEYLTTWFTAKNYQVTTDNFVSFDNTAQTSFISANEGRAGQGMLEIRQATASLSKIINRSLIEKLLKKQLSDENKLAVVEHADEFNEALDKVKICDPAIGSGAFPMGLLQEIFTAKQTIHSFLHGDLTTFKPASIKLNIIQNSIYGVDIERGAVDIARLRFWLSLVVDEPAPQALPNLDYKIVVGNSLISKLADDVIEIDWDIKPNNHGLFGAEEAKSIQTILKQITALQSQFFNPNAPKKELAPKIRNLKIDLLIQQLNLMIASPSKEANKVKAKTKFTDGVIKLKADLQTDGWKKQVQALQALKTQPDKPLEFFDWQLNFAEVINKEVAENGKVGFDIVIGNPPYVSVKKIPSTTKESLSKIYLTGKGRFNLFTLFLERGHMLQKQGGHLIYILPDGLFSNSEYRHIREYIVNNSIVLKANLFTGRVFEAAVDTAIIMIENSKAEKKVKVYSNLKTEVATFVQNELNVQPNYLFPFMVINENKNIISKINSLSKTSLEGILEVQQGIIYSGQEKTDVFSNLKISDIYKKVLDGRDISRLRINWDEKLENKFIKYTKDLHRPRDERIFLAPEKIIMPRKSTKITCAVDRNQYYLLNTAYVMLPKIKDLNLNYIAGLLNSKLIGFFYSSLYFGWQITIPAINSLPIIIANRDIEGKIADLVKSIESLKSLNSNADICNFESQIDLHVYRLYNLTFDEVKLIDPEFALTEAEYNLVTVE